MADAEGRSNGGDIAALNRRIRKDRSRSAAASLLPADVIADRIIKYEKHLNGLLNNALHELERLQARRGGMPSLPPVVADLNVSIVEG